MVIYDIPKEFRVVTKVDMTSNYCIVHASLSYVSIRSKVDHSELKFFCMRLPAYSIDIAGLKSSFDVDVSISIVTDNRCNNRIDYSEYDTLAYQSVSYIQEV